MGVLTSYESGLSVLPLLVMDPPALFPSARMTLQLRWRRAVGARVLWKTLRLTDCRPDDTRLLVRIILAVCMLESLQTLRATDTKQL